MCVLTNFLHILIFPYSMHIHVLLCWKIQKSLSLPKKINKKNKKNKNKSLPFTYFGIVVWWTFMIELHNFHGQKTTYNFNLYEIKANVNTISRLWIDSSLYALFTSCSKWLQCLTLLIYRNIHFLACPIF